MNLENSSDIRFKALEKSHYCTPYRIDNFIETIDVDQFDVDEIKDKVRKSVPLLSHTNPYREYIVEILDILFVHKEDFLTDMHKYISFYWSGVPVLLITIDKGLTQDKQLHISLQKYKSEKKDIISDKKQSRLLMLGLGFTLFIGGFVVAMAIKKKHK